MTGFVRLTHGIALNAVPFAGVFWRDWSDSTAVSFYWCETVLVILFVSLRLMIHQRATRKRGHYVETKTSRNGGAWKTGQTTYNSAFLWTAIAFSAGNLVFLVVILGLFPDNVGAGTLDAAALKRGLLLIFAFIAGMFVLELPMLARRSFASVKRSAEAALARVFIVYAAIFVGMFAAMMLNRPHTLFGVFFTLKLFIDLTGGLKQWNPASPPTWLSALANDPKFASDWQAQHADAMKIAAEDELPFAGVPSRAGHSASRPKTFMRSSRKTAARLP